MFLFLAIPRIPTITGYKEGTLLADGTILTLHCTGEQGNPPGKLVWTQGKTNGNI